MSYKSFVKYDKLPNYQRDYPFHSHGFIWINYNPWLLETTVFEPKDIGAQTFIQGLL